MFKRWVLRKEFFGGLLYDKLLKDYFYVDVKAFNLIAEIFGRQKLNLIGNGEYLNFLEKNKIVSKKNDRYVFEGGIIVNKKNLNGFPSSPLRIHLALTYKCPFNCDHCFVKKYAKEKEELTTSEIKNLLDRLVEIGTYEILISGGEPMTRPDLFECLQYAISKGMIVKLFTSGLFIDKASLDKLKDLKLAYLAIGLDGSNSRSYQSIRQKDVFDKILKNIKLAKKYLNIPIAVQFTCTKRNTDNQILSRLVDLVIENDLILRVRPVNPGGNAMDHPDLFLDYSEYLNVLKRLQKLFPKNKYFKIKAKQGNIGLKFSKRSIKFDESFLPYTGWGCPGGYVHAFIDPYGNMYPCGFLINYLPKTQDNNIKNRDILDIWLHGRQFIYKRDLKGNNKCYKCKYLLSCRGGCRCRAKYWNNDINSPDLYCRNSYEKNERFLIFNDCI